MTKFSMPTMGWIAAILRLPYACSLARMVNPPTETDTPEPPTGTQVSATLEAAPSQ